VNGGASTPRLALRALEKRYGSQRALADVSLDLAGGTIHGLLGENGAGKSTLVRIVAGALVPDGGTMAIDGAIVPFAGPRAARAAGIGVVYQHFALVGALSVAENLFLGRPEAEARVVSPARLAADARSLAERHGIAIGDPAARVDTLPVGAQARLEILRALSARVRILLLDEPTAVLTPNEITDLFATLRRLRDEGVLIVLITHKLGEALDVCDTVTVMRGGRLVTTLPAHGTSPASLATLMVGAVEDDAIAATDTAAPASVAPAGPAALALRGVCTRPGAGHVALDHVTLDVAAGEICGVAGVDGNGQDELAAALFGLLPRTGEVRVGASAVASADVGAAQRAGLALIPGDRRRDGLALRLAIWENVLLSRPLLTRATRRGLLDVEAARRDATELAGEYRVSYQDVEQPIGDLSGGNQQRIVIGRSLATTPAVLIAVNPTRGLDIGASAHVHATLRRIAATGTAVLLVSTDLDELHALCARLFVLYRGALRGPVARGEGTRLAALMAGIAP
jgi:simple sugar transport system ATP-binding protein